MSKETPAIRSSRTTLHTAPLPYFVRHNPGLKKGLATAAAAATPYITVHLVQDNSTQSHIEYWITDKDGPGDKHSKQSNNDEDPNSSIFSTIFPLTDISVTPTKGGEVRIQGTAIDGTCYAWKSKSKHRISNDSDVLWKNVKCK